MRKKVMVVDDDPDIRFTVNCILEPMGFNVITVDGALECIEELRRGFRGVILMDIMMPNMDGWKAIRKIANRGFLEGNIICILSARHNLDVSSERLGDMDLYYMQKPIDRDELIECVEEYCSLVEDTEAVALCG
ncbi:MAG: response regulator [Chloroflexota bacterium]|nr:response regulator [Chloroflexota bacterium]